MGRIGHTHVRDFDLRRSQRALAELAADDAGYVRFSCLKCPRTGLVELAQLRARFRPTEGLVNILNSLAPPDCPLAAPDASGNRTCGYCYRDLLPPARAADR